MAERQFGPYRLVRQIAVGGMAEIHLAKTKGIAGFEKYVALKMIHPNFAEDEQFIQMLVDEAKIAVQLNHANIAQTFDLGRVGENFYITMEYVDGADLYKVLRKGSEMDVEMPLEVAAYIAKEVASALDHAHRKRDHAGKPLGIVHRDVSPQNVLISFSGEVKLVDFGIAKASMKARQTAVGVIKGKYYYMSPEQAWGDPIDFRSDIFSAGIVLYEMITGQMLYLEEDLHKLLDMARRADIASPTTLRRGIPAQLERIVMHALARAPGDRYQSAADFATDLERFLHAYSPISTATKVAALIKKIIGDPMPVPDVSVAVERRDGPISTHELNSADIVHSPDELRDENSMIFALGDLKPPTPAPAPAPALKPLPKLASVRSPTQPPARSPTQPPARSPTQPPTRSPTQPPARSPTQPPVVQNPRPRALSRPRNRDEETREVPPAPFRPEDESGLLSVAVPAKRPSPWDSDNLGTDSELENTGERTMITGAPGGFMMDADGIEATMVSGAPQLETDELDADDLDDRQILSSRPAPPPDAEDGPTIQRDFARPRRVTAQRPGVEPSAALAGKIHAPAVSELRSRKPSRKTPSAGMPSAVMPNVLQQLVGSTVREAMPAPRQTAELAPPPPQPLGAAVELPPGVAAGLSPGIAAGLPLGVATPPPGAPMQVLPGVPPHLQPYANQPYAQPYYAPPMTPGALYQFQPQGAPTPSPMSATGQLRLFEVNENQAQYRMSSGIPHWLKVGSAGALAVSVAAGVTFFIIRSMQSKAPALATVHIDTTPEGAEVFFDGVHLAGTTPLTVPNTPAGKSVEIRLELAHHRPDIEMFTVPAQGGDAPFTAILKPLTGKLVIVTTPDGAEIRIDNVLRGRTPATINDVDLEKAKTVELRLKDYQPVIQSLRWPASGEIDIDAKLVH